jgi:riboflavin biosynthesis pyrimidine reductase
LDGVVSLDAPGQAGGGEISGSNSHDRMVIGLLRAVASAVIVGAGTLRAHPHHLWTADHIYPPLANEYHRLRTLLGKPPAPLNVIVTASGHLDLSLPVFRTGEVPALIVTTPHGAQRLDAAHIPPSVRVVAGDGGRTLSARAIVAALDHAGSGDVILVEGGPHLIGDFFAEQCLHELFLTLAPQVAGRDGTTERPGLVSGKAFAPEQPLWGTLTGLKRGQSHLFLRYAFATGNPGTL